MFVCVCEKGGESVEGQVSVWRERGVSYVEKRVVKEGYFCSLHYQE